MRRLACEAIAVASHHKERLASILAPRHVLFDPVERARAEKHHALFVAFADDGCLPRLEIDGGALQRQCLRDPHAGAEEHLHQHPEA